MWSLALAQTLTHTRMGFLPIVLTTLRTGLTVLLIMSVGRGENDGPVPLGTLPVYLPSPAAGVANVCGRVY